jgi:hypothetical protein
MPARKTTPAGATAGARESILDGNRRPDPCAERRNSCSVSVPFAKFTGQATAGPAPRVPQGVLVMRTIFSRGGFITSGQKSLGQIVDSFISSGIGDCHPAGAARSDSWYFGNRSSTNPPVCRWRVTARRSQGRRVRAHESCAGPGAVKNGHVTDVELKSDSATMS